ncbi:MAG TPA: class I SAM-dependent methyltransferase [Longimicrobium sp.]|nr:class I SAM-dependent methyltransferase [Longimicrobium sp.]
MPEPASAAPSLRTDTSAVEPRYLALLEGERKGWWTEENFETWKNLYVSEYARGFAIADTLARHVPGFRAEGARVLDVGCGDAGVPIAFAEHGARVAGIELSERSVARGRLRAEEHRVDVDLRQGVAEALPWEDESFDLVVMDNVLEHVQDRPKSLSEIRRVLRPGGLLYLVTPKPFALASLWSDPHYQLAGLVLMPRAVQVWYFERVRGGGKGNYGVGVIPTRHGVRRLLRRAGFEELTRPRDLWIEYLRRRIASPEEVRPEKRKLATWLKERGWIFENPASRAALDVALGSNFFIARKTGSP